MNLIPVEYKSERILTTEQLAQAYQCEGRNISDNFKNNQDKFIEGKHYFKLEGTDLKAFKSYSENIGLPVNKFAPTFYLWTKRGASRHCKMLGTEKAWEQFDALEENYFAPKLCIEDALIAQIQQLKAIRIEQEEQKKRLAVCEQNITEIAAKSETSQTDYFTVAGYASLRGMKVDVSRASIIGRRASKMSRSNGYDIGHTSDPRFGKVNTYHLDILKEIFETESRRTSKLGFEIQ